MVAGACSTNSPSSREAGLGQPPEDLAFVDGGSTATTAQTVAKALIDDTLIADAAGARCASERIAGQLSIAAIDHVRTNGTLGGLDLTAAEAQKLVDALFDCADPRDGVIVGMHAEGLDPLAAECIGRGLSSEIYADAMVHSFSNGSASGLQQFADDFTRAATGC